MGWLQNAFTRRMNVRHRLWGHLFGGRYKAILAEPGNCFWALMDYTRLNPKMDWLATMMNFFSPVMPAAARTICSNSCRFIAAEDLQPFRLTKNPGKRRGTALALAVVGIFRHEVQDFLQGTDRKDCLPFTQGILAGFRKTGFAQGAVQPPADKIYQLWMPTDFFRQQPVKLQTAFVDEIMLNLEKDRGFELQRKAVSWKARREVRWVVALRG